MINNTRISVKLNLILMGVFVFFNLFAMFYLPLVLLPQHLVWALILVPIVLCTNSFWSLIHEGIHHVFHPKKSINILASRTMAIIFGTVFQVVQFGHLIHHAYSRTSVDRPEVFEESQHNYFKQSLLYYFKLSIGLYLAEFFGPCMAFLPKVLLMKIADKLYVGNLQVDKIIKNRLFSDESIRIIRTDAIVMYLLFALTFVCYGAHAWLWILFMVARGFLVSVADNLPHYGTPVEEVRYAYNLSMPQFLSRFILNFNLHRTHHEDPTVPWSALVEVYEAKKDSCDMNYFKQGMRQFKGLINLNELNTKTSSS